MLVAGIDVGSLSAEAVILDDSGRILGASIIPTGANAGKAGRECLDKALSECGRTVQDLSSVVATGYGRISIDFATSRVTEITCHAKGARYFFADARTVIDIGGQDSKVIAIGKDGRVTDFVMNDKCAAGTGRFLEVMAKALELDVEELGPLGLASQTSAVISSMCTVFAESEVVSLVAEGRPREEIIRGIHDAIAERTLALARRLGVKAPVVMTGGVAKNQGVVKSLEFRLQTKILIPPEPQITGALGAALSALGR
ncbi:MAG TPA: 2-hydroxyglutaryl-CoA dehydratase [Clostridia bacterium]|nr:2-hydroxyglutaryl-CoA dehydratase [Clostridia bacterium]